MCIYSFLTGSNLHGFVNDFESKTKKTNLPELLHQLKIRTGDYNINEDNMSRVKTIDDKIKVLEYTYANQILSENNM